MTLSGHYIPEPLLEFAHGQNLSILKTDFSFMARLISPVAQRCCASVLSEQPRASIS